MKDKEKVKDSIDMFNIKEVLYKPITAVGIMMSLHARPLNEPFVNKQSYKYRMYFEYRGYYHEYYFKPTGIQKMVRKLYKSNQWNVSSVKKTEGFCLAAFISQN